MKQSRTKASKRVKSQVEARVDTKNSVSYGKTNRTQFQPLLLVLIPAYNEATTIREVIREIRRRPPAGVKTKVLVVDDGSTDKTAAISRRAGASVISHPYNLGVGVAMQTGLQAAINLKADLAVNIDADGQFRPQDINLLIKPLLSGRAEVVIGSRFANHRITPPMPSVKYWGNKFLAGFLSWFLHQKISDATCGFRAYSREAILRLQLFGSHTYTQEMFLQLQKHHLRFVEMPVKVLTTKRPGGQSRVVNSLLKYVWQAGLILLRSFRDYHPFAFFGVPALLLGVVGLVAGLFTLIHYLQVGEITPYKSLGFIALFAWLGSLLMFVFALLSDMLDRLRTQQEKIIYYLRQQ